MSDPFPASLPEKRGEEPRAPHPRAAVGEEQAGHGGNGLPEIPAEEVEFGASFSSFFFF